MSKEKNSDFNFEKSLKNLEDVVKKLESSDLPLEDSLSFFEKGVGIAKDCEQHLKTAEQKIEILTSSTKDKDPNSFETDSFNDDETNV